MLQKKYMAVIINILFLVFTLPAISQIPGYKSFTLEDNTAKIFSLFKDQQGYLLVGSNNGLYKFDGVRFRKIETEKPGPGDTVTAVFQDNRQTVWAGYQGGSIAKAVTGKLRNIEPEEGMPGKRITSFLQDQQNNLWFGTMGEGIYHFDGNRLYLINEENGLSDLNIYALALAGNGEVIAATDQGLAICSGKGVKKTVSMIGPSQGLPDYIATSIAPAGNDNFWIGLHDKGICLYNHASKKITVPLAAAGWNKGPVNGIIYTQGNVWITTPDSGLIFFSPASGLLTSMPVLTAQQKSSAALTEDNQGNVWMIIDNRQLVRVSCNALKLHRVYNDEFFVTVHTILVDHAKNLWTGTDLAVVKYTHSEGGYRSRKYPVAGLDIKTDVTCLYEDKFNNIWIGTMGNGLYVLDPLTGKTRQLKEAMTSGSILSITGTGNSICTAGLEGAYVFELTDANSNINKPYRFKSYDNIQTIGSTYIYNVFKDSKGRLWFATDGKGLTLLSNGVFTHYNQKDGISDEHIYSVTEDSRGMIWFSTSNAGVYRFDGKKFTNYSMANGLSSLSVSAIKVDGLGNIIVIHKDGIDIIDGESGNVSYINASQAVSGINDALGAVCIDGDGNVYVGTKTGILQYTPLPGIQTVPATVIESVQLFLNDIDTAARHYFKYDENNISFNFTGLYLTSPDKIFYQYKLEGLDSAWQFTNDNSKVFPKLPPSKYTFRVRSALNKNFENVQEAAYSFEIARPFWKTWWFISTCALLFAALLYWYIKRREANLTHIERLRGEKVKFEFEVLRNQVNPHFLFNSFNTLISTIEDDPKTAVEYVEQLSDFFRNIVTYRDRDTIPLVEEISLLQNYLYLQQKRYGSHLQLDVNVSPEQQERIFLPPLTLQLLSENAIKHNNVSKEASLLIRVDAKDGYIFVQNNINPKINKEKGTGMGLQNIESRYAMLCEKPVLITNNKENFTVGLPIIKHA